MLFSIAKINPISYQLNAIYSNSSKCSRIMLSQDCLRNIYVNIIYNIKITSVTAETSLEYRSIFRCMFFFWNIYIFKFAFSLLDLYRTPRIFKCVVGITSVIIWGTKNRFLKHPMYVSDFLLLRMFVTTSTTQGTQESLTYEICASIYVTNQNLFALIYVLITLWLM